jgi:hypothetical protein
MHSGMVGEVLQLDADRALVLLLSLLDYDDYEFNMELTFNIGYLDHFKSDSVFKETTLFKDEVVTLPLGSSVDCYLYLLHDRLDL